MHGFGRIGGIVGFGICIKLIFLKFLFKAKVVPVIIVQGEKTEETPLPIGIPLIQRTV